MKMYLILIEWMKICLGKIKSFYWLFLALPWKLFSRWLVSLWGYLSGLFGYDKMSVVGHNWKHNWTSSVFSHIAQLGSQIRLPVFGRSFILYDCMFCVATWQVWPGIISHGLWEWNGVVMIGSWSRRGGGMDLLRLWMIIVQNV